MSALKVPNSPNPIYTFYYPLIKVFSKKKKKISLTICDYIDDGLIIS